MTKACSRKGFSLAELLTVVAIIAVLVAVAIPIFSSQLERSREATDLANIRSAYAQVMADAVSEGAGTYSASVALQQQTPGWQTERTGNTLSGLIGEGQIQGSPQKEGRATVIWQDGMLTLVFEGALPVTYSESDYRDPVIMSRKYGEIVSYLQKNASMPRLNSRYSYYGEGATDADRVKIITVQTGDGQTRDEIKDAMKALGYSDDDISKTYGGLRYAYLDGNGNLLGYHGAGAGGRSQLYIVGYGSNPVSVAGSEDAKDYIAALIQAGSLSGN